MDLIIGARVAAAVYAREKGWTRTGTDTWRKPDGNLARWVNQPSAFRGVDRGTAIHDAGGPRNRDLDKAAFYAVDTGRCIWIDEVKEETP